MAKPIVEITADGSQTIYISDIDEHYHSIHGAVSESRHVYIENGLLHYAKLNPDNRIKVFELGLGTGLNAALAASTGIQIDYTAIEKFPLPPAIVNRLDFGTMFSPRLLKEIHSSPWNQWVAISDSFRLHKLTDDFLHYRTDDAYDVIFMDAFAPEKQPELWTDDVIAKLTSMLNPGGIMTTYCAKGRIRRAFKAAGLTASRLPGPPGGKREILRLSKDLD